MEIASKAAIFLLLILPACACKLPYLFFIVQPKQMFLTVSRQVLSHLKNKE